MDTEKRKTILLVEDESIIAIAEAQTIARFGYEVVIASSGKEAVHLAVASREIDLILMDIDLGDGIDGLEAARQILEERDMPIVFLTSYSRERSGESGKAIGNYGYVMKNTGNSAIRSSIDAAARLTNG